MKHRELWASFPYLNFGLERSKIIPASASSTSFFDFIRLILEGGQEVRSWRRISAGKIIAAWENERLELVLTNSEKEFRQRQTILMADDF